jgi:copper(I)-binding protein
MAAARNLALALALAGSLQSGAKAQDVGALHIGYPWVKATPNAAPTAAGYLTVTNRGRTADRLLGGSSPLAQAIEPHTMSMSGGIMRMRLAAGGFQIAPGATLALTPGGDHLMLIGPRRTFKVGERIPATLRFAHAGAVKLVFVVRAEAPPVAMPGMNIR